MNAAARPLHHKTRGGTYHGNNDGIVILAQSPTDQQPRSSTGHDEAEADDIEHNRDDDEDHATAMEANISFANDPFVDETHDREGRDCNKNLRSDFFMISSGTGFCLCSQVGCCGPHMRL